MKAQFDNLRETFAQRFEADGASFVYRAGPRAAPVAVSPEERDGFVAAFRRQLYYLMAFLLLGMLAIVAGVVVLAGDRGGDVDMPLYGGIAIVITAYAFGYYRIWTAPTRELRDRQPAGPGWNRDEARAHFFDQLGYAQLAGAVGMAALMIFNASRKNDIFHGWARLWLVFGAGIVILAGVQALRKWRHESRTKGDDAT